MIKCTGNNGNGCFMDSCGHDCGCEGLKEFGEYMKKSFNEKKLEVINQVVEYLNHRYPNVTVLYGVSEFTIHGDELEAEECRRDIEDSLKFSAKEIKKE